MSAETIVEVCFALMLISLGIALIAVGVHGQRRHP